MRSSGVAHRRHLRPRLAVAARQVLVLVDMPEGHVIPGRLGQRRLRHGQVAAGHHAALGPENGAGHGEVPGQQARHGLLGGLPGQVGQRLGDHGLQGAVQRLQGRLAVFFARQQAVAHRERHPGQEERAAPGLEDAPARRPPDRDFGHLQRAKDVDGRGARGQVGQIVVAHQHKDRHALGQTLNAARELALLGRVRVARLESVAGEQHQVGGVVHGIGADLV